MMKRRRFAKLPAIVISILTVLNLLGFVLVGAKLSAPLPAILEPLIPGLPNDNEPPVIVLDGEPEVTLIAGQTYIELGARVSDNADPVVLETSGEVDVNTPGVYYIKYQAVDFSGNHDIVKRKVTVVAKKGTIYLTFDDGPGDYTAELLDILKKFNVKATFFVTGKGEDALIRREVSEGHAVGSHTASHNYAYIYRNTDNFMSDLNAVRERIYDLTGYNTNLMRFPGGSSNLVSRNYDGRTRIMSKLTRLVTEQGWTYFDWNVDSDDAGVARDPETVFNNVASGLAGKAKAVVLQHDIKDYSVAAVENIIKYGLANGYEFKKLDENAYTAHHSVNN